MCRFKRQSYEDVKEHAEKDCSFRMTNCPNNECDDIFMHKNLREHMRLCRLKRCKNFVAPKYGCTVMGTADFIRQHESKCVISQDLLKQIEELVSASQAVQKTSA
jgi:hypothetical protein